MAVIILNIAQCALKGIKKGLKTILDIELEEDPKFTREEIQEPRVYGSNEEYIAVVTFKNEIVQASGFVIVILPKKEAKRLLKRTGVNLKLTEETILDACGELCSMVAGSFKKELSRLGKGLVEIGTPQKFANGVDAALPQVKTYSKYTVTINYQKQYLLTIEISFQSLGAAL